MQACSRWQVLSSPHLAHVPGCVSSRPDLEVNALFILCRAAVAAGEAGRHALHCVRAAGQCQSRSWTLCRQRTDSPSQHQTCLNPTEQCMSACAGKRAGLIQVHLKSVPLGKC